MSLTDTEKGLILKQICPNIGYAEGTPLNAGIARLCDDRMSGMYSLGSVMDAMDELATAQLAGTKLTPCQVIILDMLKQSGILKAFHDLLEKEQ